MKTQRDLWGPAFWASFAGFAVFDVVCTVCAAFAAFADPFDVFFPVLLFGALCCLRNLLLLVRLLLFVISVGFAALSVCAAVFCFIC